MANLIMVVDDDSGMLTLIDLILGRAGFKVKTARSAREALGLLAESIPDLFLLDVMMPEMDGVELCRRIRSLPKTSTTPVVFLSAHGDRAYIEKGLTAGATDYIAKPISNGVLVSKINSILCTHEAQKQ